MRGDRYHVAGSFGIQSATLFLHPFPQNVE
jgi:predicted nucleic acid-binding protein